MKVIAKSSGKSPFLEYLWFQSDALKFQCVKCVDNHVIEEKAGVQRQNSKEGFERNEHVPSKDLKRMRMAEITLGL